ncbi:hypothetical protein [Streptomyces enissocaesilis]|uniref:Polymerase beta nucleotidyltransferase domain-containing protein n=1 Tax=Streptomyces enissocaesilis TaxID=332589 RepID=A0ABN3X984_9ACTN
MPRMSPAPALDRRIERLRAIARSDQRLDGVLLYGSWTLGEADAHSDIEAYLSMCGTPTPRTSTAASSSSGRPR